MASVTAEEIPETRDFIHELWGLIKKYYKPDTESKEALEAYWEAFRNETNELNRKHNENRLNQILMLGVMEFLAEQVGEPGEYRTYKADRIAEDFIKGKMGG